MVEVVASVMMGLAVAAGLKQEGEVVVPVLCRTVVAAEVYLLEVVVAGAVHRQGEEEGAEVQTAGAEEVHGETARAIPTEQQEQMAPRGRQQAQTGPKEDYRVPLLCLRRHQFVR